MRLLVIEDDPDLNRQLATALTDAGYVVDRAFDGEEGHYLGETEPYDAVILDIGLPKMDGISVLESWRRAGRAMPVLMLTARDAIADRVAGLDAGADDYLVKPFALDELLARMRALLRRAGPSLAKPLTFADVTLDPSTVVALRGSRAMDLTRTEWHLLELFLRNPGRVLSHAQIFQAVWGYEFGLRSNNLWVYMGYLRTKLEAAGEPRILHTVRGLGYVLRDAP